MKNKSCNKKKVIKQVMRQSVKTDTTAVNFDEFPSENPSPVLRIDSKGNILYRNNATVAILKKVKLSEKNILKILPGRINSLIRKSLRTKKMISDLDVLVGDRYFSYSIAPVPESQYVNLYAMDITERKKVECDLRESEVRHRTLFQKTRNAVAVYRAVDDGKDFVFMDMNAAGERIDKISKKNIINRKVTEVFPGVKKFGLFKIFREVWKTGKPRHHHIKLYKDDRISGWRENYVYKLPTGEVVAIYEDVTKRKEVELKLVSTYKDLKGAYISVIKSLAMTMKYKDPYTRDHSEDVAAYIVLIARELGLNKKATEELREAAQLHDLGKISVSDRILQKPGKLTAKEWKIIKEHPKKASDILKPLKTFEKISNIIKHHHERYDGAGYPDGIKGKDIPLGSRMIALVDSFDAMITDRPYRKAVTIEQAVQELKDCSGKQFDLKLVKVFLNILRKNNKLSNIKKPHESGS